MPETPAPAAADSPLRLDCFLVSRLILGMLSDREQRQLLVRLLAADAAFRQEMAPFLALLVGDYVADELSRLEVSLAAGAAPETPGLSRGGQSSAEELEEILSTLTFDDLFALGDATRRLFCPGMAFHALARVQKPGLDPVSRRTRLLVAALTVDGLEILATGGVLPPHPRLHAFLRRRLQETGQPILALGPRVG